MMQTVEKRDHDSHIREALEEVIQGLGMTLIEFSVFRAKGKFASNVQVKLVVMTDGITGLDDCSAVHRAVMPRLELAFPDRDVFLEVSSPGIDRLIKDRGEFIHYMGREIRCYRTDISDWSSGILREVESSHIVLQTGNEDLVLPFDVIAKARLGSRPNS